MGKAPSPFKHTPFLFQNNRIKKTDRENHQNGDGGLGGQTNLTAALHIHSVTT